MMTYADPKRQREACKLAMRVYRQKKRAGLVKEKEDPAPYMSVGEIQERIDSLQKSADESLVARKKEKYNSPEYRNYTSYVSKINQRIDVWRFHLAMKGVNQFTAEELVKKLNKLNEKLEKCNHDLSTGRYKQTVLGKKNPEEALLRLSARIRNLQTEIERWNKLLAVMSHQSPGKQTKGKVSAHV